MRISLSFACIETETNLAPGLEPDLDDSAKASIVLSLIGKPGFSQEIIENFQGQQCLKTYAAERDPSISANCNALISMLVDKHDYPSKMNAAEKILAFLLGSWKNSNGNIKDKWVSA